MKHSKLKSTKLVATVLLSISQLMVGYGWQENGAAPVIVVQFFLPGGRLPSREIKFDLRREIGSVEAMKTDQTGRVEIRSMVSRAFNLSGRRSERCRVVVNADKGNFSGTAAVLTLGSGQRYAPIFLSPLSDDQQAGLASSPETGELDKRAPMEAEAAFEEAAKAVRANNPETAVSEFTRALRRYPQFPKALNQLGLLYFNQNRFEEAVAALTQAVSVSRRFPAARLNLGAALNRMEKPGEAARVLAELVADYPEESKARVMLADSLTRIQQWDEAADQLRQALADPKLNPDLKAVASYQLGQIFYHEERYNAAIKESEKALATDPNMPNKYQIYLLQGSAFYQLKKIEDAEKALVMAYEIGGKRATGANLILGRIYTDRQKYESALKAYEQYLQDFPNSPNAQMTRAAIERVKGMMKK